MAGQLGLRCFDEQTSEKRLEPESLLIFVAVDDLENLVAGNHCGARGRKVRLEFPAISAVKSSRYGSRERKTATFTKRGLDAAYFRAADRTNESVSRSRSLLAASLTYLRIKKAQASIQPDREGLGQ